MREFIHACKDDNPFPYLVESRYGRFSDYNVLRERFMTEEEALHAAEICHEQGYVVQVFLDIAYTVGELDES